LKPLLKGLLSQPPNSLILRTKSPKELYPERKVPLKGIIVGNHQLKGLKKAPWKRGLIKGI